MKNLLDILERERKICNKIEEHESRIRFYEERIKSIFDIEGNDLCRAAIKDIEDFNLIIEELEYKRADASLELEICRAEIRWYFKELFKENES